MKLAVVLIVGMVMMMSQKTDAGWGWRWRWQKVVPFIPAAIAVAGKRDVEDPDFQAKLKAAAEDGVLTNDEIKSVFGVDDNGLTEFKQTYDMDGDGVVKYEEYEAVVAIAASMSA